MGELRRKGVRIKLNSQPFRVLSMLLDRPSQVLTREEIARELWPEGVFVDAEHGVNSAINRIREALGDSAANPRFIETMARRGYRFIAPVERLEPVDTQRTADPEPPSIHPSTAAADSAAIPSDPEPTIVSRMLAAPDELPRASHRTVQTLFVLLQLMYVSFYVGALTNLAEIDDLLTPLPHATVVFNILIVTAAILIPARAFVLTTTLLHAPRARANFLRIWPLLLVSDELWSLSPFLLLHHINYGLAIACTTLLVYAPFAQRSLVLMGACTTSTPANAGTHP